MMCVPRSTDTCFISKGSGSPCFSSAQAPEKKMTRRRRDDKTTATDMGDDCCILQMDLGHLTKQQKQPFLWMTLHAHTDPKNP
mmetsp:Transcript_11901/g.27699  ORF Transcript_11901/g.27699 Transcript_11901/m.27699 type:complete len:83 (+) Transcript_11901:1256-1504(+)